MDLGECVKVHDLALRADYEIASKKQEYFFELDVSKIIFTHSGWFSFFFMFHLKKERKLFSVPVRLSEFLWP